MGRSKLRQVLRGVWVVLCDLVAGVPIVGKAISNIFKKKGGGVSKLSGLALIVLVVLVWYHFQQGSQRAETTRVKNGAQIGRAHV